MNGKFLKGISTQLFSPFLFSKDMGKKGEARKENVSKFWKENYTFEGVSTKEVSAEEAYQVFKSTVHYCDENERDFRTLTEKRTDVRSITRGRKKKNVTT